MRSSIFTVDVSKHQTNILLINIDPKSNIYSEEVCERLKKITAGEMKDGCHTEDREGIIVEIISKDATSLRITTHFEITDVDVSYAVKKMIYVFKEFADRQPKKGFF